MLTESKVTLAATVVPAAALAVDVSMTTRSEEVDPLLMEMVSGVPVSTVRTLFEYDQSVVSVPPSTRKAPADAAARTSYKSTSALIPAADTSAEPASNPFADRSPAQAVSQSEDTASAQASKSAVVTTDSTQTRQRSAPPRFSEGSNAVDRTAFMQTSL